MTTNLQFSREVCQVLATLCGLQEGFIVDALAVPYEQRYTSLMIPKKRGGWRVLHEPCEELKVVQGALLEYLHKTFIPDPRFFGYVPGKSPVANARYHIWQWKEQSFVPEAMFHLDLKDAFPSAKVERLRLMWRSMFKVKKFLRLANESIEKAAVIREEFIDLLLYLTTYGNSLPQGAATSGYLLTLLLNHLKLLKHIDQLLEDKEYRVSVYADDITVSSSSVMSWRFRKKVMRAVNRTGFRINHKKTRYNERDHKAHCVTGVSLAVDADGMPKLTLPQETRSRLRGIIHRATCLLKEGREPDLTHDGFTLAEVHGWVGWIEAVYKNFELPSDIGLPLVHFKMEYPRYRNKRRESRWQNLDSS